ncbi:MAG: GNAT family N-acetyltransferase [Flavihumibacter sp.]|nr:GNAT family N-acetyltransferase [Flavihumibacter sp.]
MLDIRSATSKELAIVEELAHLIWPDAYKDILSSEQLDYMLRLMYNQQALQQQQNSGHQFFLAWEGSEPVGFASFSEVSTGIFKLHKIYVLPQTQGKGYGKQLLQFIAANCRQQNGKALQLNVNRHNKAKFFYEKMGFAVIQEEDINIGSGYFMNDYVMELGLE